MQKLPYPVARTISQQWESYLRDRIPETRLQLVKLLDGEATRQKHYRWLH